jgi:hypothetical protein
MAEKARNIPVLPDPNPNVICATRPDPNPNIICATRPEGRAGPGLSPRARPGPVQTSTVPIGQEAVWAPEPVWTQRL